MKHVWFTLGFSAVHLVAYVAAGVLNQKLLSQRIYGGGEQALLAPFFRNVDDPAERRRQGKLILPAQLTRAVLLSVVLYPLLGPIGDLGFGVRFAFLAGLMFVYTDLASATPFVNNIEGLVYLKPRFTTWDVFWRVQAEAVAYSLMFGGAAGWLLF